MKSAFITVLCILGITFPVLADEKENVENMLKEKTDAILAILEKKDVDKHVQKKQIMDILGPIIDFQLISKLTLGKTNWGELSEKQQKEFVNLFTMRLEKSFLDKSAMYCCVEISFKPAFTHGNKIFVPVEIETKDTPLEILYKFYSSREGWKTYDVEINGVSLIKSYQAQFSEILKSGNAEDLLVSLKKPVVK